MAILTPDQRLRVFISSTIKELAEERMAARTAISKLCLTPIFFEMGARPHPPKDLYRAYLDQSQIFIGIYWNSYGWVAPDMNISGLEDEYRLSGNKPKLIYIKSSENRDEKLKQLLLDIQSSDTACYQQFSDCKELENLISQDLSLLLSEKFQSETFVADNENIIKHNLPSASGELIGRQNELENLIDLLKKDEVRLLTLLGPGGTGKTRLSIDVANQLKNNFGEEVYYISLETIRNPDLLLPFISQYFNLTDRIHQAPEEIILQYLANKKCLIVLDNFEQINTAAPQIASLLQKLPAIKVFVTSRIPLHIRNEYIFHLEPLTIPTEEAIEKGNNLDEVSSIKLFLLRAKQINPALIISEDNLKWIARICTKLDGLPLAIELAASRTRIFTPALLFQRMEKALEILNQGPVDLPERQKTLRSTLEWSYSLLDDDSKKLFSHLAVFEGHFDIEAIEGIVNLNSIDLYTTIEKLVDASLLISIQNNSGISFYMLETIHQLAKDYFQKDEEQHIVENNHLQYYIHYLDAIEPNTWQLNRAHWFSSIEERYSNIRKAVLWSANHNKYEAYHIVGNLTFYWFITGRMREAIIWIETLNINAAEIKNKILEINNPLLCAKVLRCSGLIFLFSGNLTRAIQDLKYSAEIFEMENDELNLGRVLISYGIAAVSSGDIRASESFARGLELGLKHNDLYSIGLGSIFKSELLAAAQQLDEAKKLIYDTIELCVVNQDMWLLATAYMQAGDIETACKNYALAEINSLNCLALKKSIQLPASIEAWALVGNGFAIYFLDRKEEALHYFQASLKLANDLLDFSILQSSLIGIGLITLEHNNFEYAKQILQAAKYILDTKGFTVWPTRQYQLMMLQQNWASTFLDEELNSKGVDEQFMKNVINRLIEQHQPI